MGKKLCYSLGTNPSPVETLEDAEEPGRPLQKIYRQVLPFLGFNRNIRGEPHHLHSTFGGIGLHRLLIEVVVSCFNLFLQHYGTLMILGTKLNNFLCTLQLDIGTNGRPLHMPYNPLGLLTPPSWYKSF